MPGPLRLVAPLVVWAFIGVTSPLLLPIAVPIPTVTFPFDPRRALHQSTCFWASPYTRHLDPRTTYVMVANHLPLPDIQGLHRRRTTDRSPYRAGAAGAKV